MIEPGTLLAKLSIQKEKKKMYATVRTCANPNFRGAFAEDWKREHWHHQHGFAGFNFYPKTDIAHDDKKYIVMVDLPELTRDQVKVTLKDNILTISGKKEGSKLNEGFSYLLNERVAGKFERRFALPEDVDGSKLAAKLENGVLTVELPKLTKSESKDGIEIKIN